LALVTFLFLFARHQGQKNTKIESSEPVELVPTEKIVAAQAPGAPTEVAPSNTEPPAEVLKQNTLPSSLSAADLAKFKDFQEIARSKNDNDPRLDTEFRSLSPDLKKALQDFYQQMAPEKRNEKGLVVFLIARDLKTADDALFLRSVYAEEPCLSMESCKILTASDPHLSFADQVSLNYPQMAGLYQLEKKLAANPEFLKDPNLREKIRGILDQAVKYGVPSVQKRAEEIQNRFRL